MTKEVISGTLFFFKEKEETLKIIRKPEEEPEPCFNPWLWPCSSEWEFRLLTYLNTYICPS